MKKVKSIILYSLLTASSGTLYTSCSDSLDLSPIDYYGSGSYWQTEAHVVGYMDGIHKHLRDASFQHTFLWGGSTWWCFNQFRNQCRWYGDALRRP